MDAEDITSQLEIDENLCLLERVKRFCARGFSVQRLVHVRELATCAEEVGAATSMARLVPLLKIVSCDPELPIRQVVPNPAP